MGLCNLYCDYKLGEKEMFMMILARGDTDFATAVIVLIFVALALFAVSMKP